MPTFKKILSTFLVLGFCSIATPFQKTQAAFTDVPQNHTNYIAIEYLAGLGVISGYGDGTFGTDKEINRAELMKLVTKSLNVEPDPNVYKDCFPDVKAEWFAPYVCYGKEQGWINGYPEGVFKPNNTVTGSEALKIIFNPFFKDQIAAMNKEEQRAILGLNANAPDMWYAPFAAFAKAKNLSPFGSYLLINTYNLPRKEAAEDLFRAKLVKENGWKEFTPYQRDNFLQSSWRSDLLANNETCYQMDRIEAPFIQNYIQTTYNAFLYPTTIKKLYLDELTDQPQVVGYSFCKDLQGNITFYNSIISKTAWNMHLMTFNTKGALQKDDKVSCTALLNQSNASGERPYVYAPKLTSQAPETLDLLGCYIYKDSTKVYAGDSPLQADAATFQMVGYPYSKDATQVYCDTQVLAGADAATFEVIPSTMNGFYEKAKDKNRVYEGCQVLQGAKPEDYPSVTQGVVGS